MGDPNFENSDTLYLKLPLNSIHFFKNKSEIETMVFLISEQYRSATHLLIQRMNSRLGTKKVNILVLNSEMRKDFDFESDEGILFDLSAKLKVDRKEGFSAFLVDERGFLRGYYHPFEPEEADRMIIESEILIKE